MVSRGLLVFSLVFLAFLVRYGQSFLVPRRLAVRGMFDGAKARSAGRPLLLLPEAAAEDAPSTLKPGGLPRPDFSSVEDMKAKFHAKMIELYPGRRGFPRIADSYTQADHDEEVLKCRQECKESNMHFQYSFVKIPFIFDDGKDLLIDPKWISAGSVWSGNSKHSTPAMKKAANDRSSERNRKAQPKGFDQHTKREIYVSELLAAICGIYIKHIGKNALFDFAYGPDKSSMVYFQTSVMEFDEKIGSVSSNKSIGDIKKYLDAGGAVILVVFIHGEIDRAYILLPSDLGAFNSTTQDMKPSTVFHPSPYSTHKLRGLSKVMSKYLCKTKDEIKAKMLEHIRTGDRMSLYDLKHQVPHDTLKELYYRDPFEEWLGDFARDIYPEPNSGDIEIFGKLNVEFKLANLGNEKTKRYRAQIRRSGYDTTDFNKVRAFCFVVNDATNGTTNGATYIFVPSLTRSGTCAFAPTGSSDPLEPYRLFFSFYLKDGAFRALAEQYDESSVGDVLIIRQEDMNDESIEKLRVFADMCAARQSMNEAELKRIATPPDVLEHERGVYREGKRRRRTNKVAKANEG